MDRSGRSLTRYLASRIFRTPFGEVVDGLDNTHAYGSVILFHGEILQKWSVSYIDGKWLKCFGAGNNLYRYRKPRFKTREDLSALYFGLLDYSEVC